jgi:hypothetical protein
LKIQKIRSYAQHTSSFLGIETVLFTNL